MGYWFDVIIQPGKRLDVIILSGKLTDVKILVRKTIRRNYFVGITIYVLFWQLNDLKKHLDVIILSG